MRLLQIKNAPQKFFRLPPRNQILDPLVGGTGTGPVPPVPDTGMKIRYTANAKAGGSRDKGIRDRPRPKFLYRDRDRDHSCTETETETKSANRDRDQLPNRDRDFYKKCYFFVIFDKIFQRHFARRAKICSYTLILARQRQNLGIWSCYNEILNPKNQFLKFLKLFFLVWSRSRSNFYRDRNQTRPVAQPRPRPRPEK